MVQKNYVKRFADEQLQLLLEASGAVLIEGPKWCGKTTTAAEHAASSLSLANQATLKQNIEIAELNPEMLLAGATPRLLDEWQVLPQLWDATRYEVDKRGEVGQFILTGSAVPADSAKLLHTGTGRIARLRMRPMTLAESGESSAEVSLAELFEGRNSYGRAALTELSQIAYVLARGGWPQAVKMSSRAALLQARNYVDAVVDSDISRVDGVTRDPQLARAILRVYARYSASQAQLTKMHADIASADGLPADKTVRDYVAALQQIFVLEDLVAWNPNLRSRAAVRTSPTRHFVDPSLAVAALGASPQTLIKDLETFGLLFETLCVRDLRVYAEVNDGTVYHFRDSNGLEVDAVVMLRDGRYGLCEFKLGGDTAIAAGAKSLQNIAANLDIDRMSSPSFLAVITAVGEYAYVRKDGVHVIPISALGA